ncbi:hypothetical protein ABFX02_09G035900 [Erythranthe guttata]
MEKGSHLFVVKNYSSIHEENELDEKFESEEFVVGGHVWSIRFYPNRKTIDAHNSAFSSLYIFLKRSTADHVRYLFDMYILDQSGNGDDFGFSKFEDFPSTGVACLEPGFMHGSTEFVEREFIESTSDFLKDDCLTFRVTIGVLSSQIQYIPPVTVPESETGAYLAEVLRREEGVDVFFNVETERFCAHEWILDARCPALLSRRLSDFNQHDEINIQDIEPKIFKAMLSFVYTGILPEEEHEDDDDESNQFVHASFMGKMLAAADRYDFKSLKRTIELHVSGRISGKSVAYLLHLAELYNAEELKVACIRFLAQNEAGLDVMDPDGLKYLVEMCPLLFLDLGYKENNAMNGNHQERRHFCSKILSVVKETFAGMLLEPCDATDKTQKIKEL